MDEKTLEEYQYTDSNPTYSHGYLWPTVSKIVADNIPSDDKRIFEIGCGNGANAKLLSKMGFAVTGIDTSVSGVDMARKGCAEGVFDVASVYDALISVYDAFPVVISLEVIEHCFYPEKFSTTFFDLLSTDGIGIISTPYHGYWKNLALAVTGKMDAHFTALWQGGHIKFFSEKTLRKLLLDAGFRKVSFIRAGRIPIFAKSMIAIVRK
jgi:2-polyprenyl-3-methyl-5-hydroxy-6-metoxy-1,4-benzoquinol methylase